MARVRLTRIGSSGKIHLRMSRTIHPGMSRMIHPGMSVMAVRPLPVNSWGGVVLVAGSRCGRDLI